MSDAPTTKKVDPTQSVRTLSSKLFHESTMTLREHQDTDKHYIGDSLPVPSDVMLAATGNVGSAGVLPFPARADHVHGLRTVWGQYTASQATIAPGNVYIPNLAYTGWGRNMLVSSQVLAFPLPGLYLINLLLNIQRNGGGVFQNEMNIVFSYQNGNYNRVVWRGSNFDVPTQLNISLVDFLLTASAPSSNDNVQFAIQHNDTVYWTVDVSQLIVARISDTSSN